MHGDASRGPLRSSLAGLALSGLATAMAMVGCRTPTQLLVVVDTDLEPGTEVTAVDVSVTAEASLPAQHRFELPETDLPFTFGVTPARAFDEEVRIVAIAIGPGEARVVRRSLRTSFLEGRTLRVSIPLGRACAVTELECGDGETCSDGGCATDLREPSELPETSADAPVMRLFDGPRVAPDAGPPGDGGPIDDAGALVCVQEEECDTGDPCRPGAMNCDADLPECVPGEPLAEGSACGNGRQCDAEGLCR